MTAPLSRPRPARRATLPSFVAPALAKLVPAPPDGQDWLHEIKYDGYRLLCRVERFRPRLLTRSGSDWTDRFPALAGHIGRWPVQSLLIDGEAVVLDAAGVPRFQLLQNALSLGGGGEIVYYAFDLLHLDGRDFRDVPIEERKEALRRVVSRASHARGRARGRARAHSPVRYSEHVVGSGSKLLSNACAAGAEGLVSKRCGSLYRSGRRGDWLKSRCSLRQEFVIGGFTSPSGARTDFGSLLLGVYEGPGRLVYAGRVGTGFDRRMLARVRTKMDSLRRRTTPFVEPPARAELRGGGPPSWVEPRLVCEVEFTEWTRDGKLRHPTFRGLREDKPASEVVREMPKTVRVRSGAGGKAPGAGRRTRGAHPELTHPDRVLYEGGVTKVELARYMEAAAPWILPHAADRPLMLRRCPSGPDAPCFFQKHGHPSLPQSVRRVSIQEEDGPAEAIAIDDPAGLLALVQVNTAEIHAWGSRARRIEKPDVLVFDLDPGTGVAWKTVVALAEFLRERLGDLGLDAFVKVTGGKGLHVTVPIRPRLEWPAVRAFCRAVADETVRRHPRQATAIVSLSRRAGKIFVDYLRNGRGATAVVPYSPRARRNAPVALPVSWEELPRLRPEGFPLRKALAVLNERADPWDGFFRTRQSLTARMLKAVGAEVTS